MKPIKLLARSSRNRSSRVAGLSRSNNNQQQQQQQRPITILPFRTVRNRDNNHNNNHNDTRLCCNKMNQNENRRWQHTSIPYYLNGADWKTTLNGKKQKIKIVNNNDHKNHNNDKNKNNNNDDASAATASSSSSAPPAATLFVRGTTLDHAVDLRTMIRVGDKLDIPYECTITEPFVDAWHSAFYSQDRITASRPFCRNTLRLQDRLVPFSLALFLATSMSHIDAAVVQVGFGNIHYAWPTFCGDTITKSFTIQSMRNTSDGKRSIIHFICELINQRGRTCMRADKRMLFPFTIPAAATATTANNNNNDSINNSDSDKYVFRDHLLSKGSVLAREEHKQKSQSWTQFAKGQCILHTMNRSLTFTQSQQLATLARLTHERHFDTLKYSKTAADDNDDDNTIYIPGGLIIGLTASVSARDLQEILYEEIVSVNYFHTLHPNQTLSAISYVSDIQKDSLLSKGSSDRLEIVTITTLGIKNCDVKRELDGVDIPLELFQTTTTTSATTNQQQPPNPPETTTRIKRKSKKEIEHICRQHCPVLQNKIVIQMERKIMRQSKRDHVFLL